MSAALNLQAIAAALVADLGVPNPEGAWRAFQRGEYAVVDRFELEGRSFVLARRRDTTERLSHRSRRALELRAAGVALKVIAFELGVSPATVSRDIARSIVGAKIRNARQNIARGARDTEDADTEASLREATASLDSLLRSLPEADTVDAIRGIEGQAAAVSFGVFGRLILRDKAEFAFTVRTRRPPRDRVNALLSFLYTLLQGDCTAALEGVGLDPQFGFLHALRPGRPALALDLMEEFRPCIADRLALTLINRRQINPAQFEEHEKGAVLLNEEGRKIVLTEYQKRKQEEVRHPFLKETTPLGLVPHLQARLLARHLRGDLPSYSPFTVR